MRAPSLCPICGQQVLPRLLEQHVAGVHRVCFYCGPWTATSAKNDGSCPTCGLDPGECAYIERILADSATVYAEEARAFNARRSVAVAS